MKGWFTNINVLWSAIGLLIAALIYFISLVRSYEPEINRLRLENIKQDSVIVYLEIKNKQLKNQMNDEFDNIYDVFHKQHKQLKMLKGE